MKKISLFLGASCLLCAVEMNSLANVVSKIDVNATKAEMKVSENNISAKAVKPFYEGEVVTVQQGGAYTYLEIKEKTNKTLWIAVNSADVKVADFVRFKIELVMKDFKSKALKKTFPELMFASGLEQKIIKK